MQMHVRANMQMQVNPPVSGKCKVCMQNSANMAFTNFTILLKSSMLGHMKTQKPNICMGLKEHYGPDSTISMCIISW